MRALHVEFQGAARASHVRWWAMGLLAAIALALHGGAWHLEQKLRAHQEQQAQRLQEVRAAAERAAQERLARAPVIDELSRLQLQQYRFDLGAVLSAVETAAVAGVRPTGLAVEPGAGQALLDIEYEGPSALLAYLDALNAVHTHVQWTLATAQAPPGPAGSPAASPGQARLRGHVASEPVHHGGPPAK